MNWIKKLFKIKKDDVSPIKKYEQLLINRVIELLEKNPDFFSSRWFNENSIDSSIQSNDRNILIRFNSGQITTPTRPTMTKEQRKIVKDLLVPIVERDGIFLIKNLIKK